MREFETILDEFEEAWRTGQSPDARSCLEKVSANQQAALLFELLTIEVFYRRQRGEIVSASAYSKSWPEYRSVVARVFEESESHSNTEDRGARSLGLFSNLEHQNSSDETSAPNYPAENVSTTHTVPAAGVMVGQYRLVKPLGVGGMGQVWLAEQELPVRRQVALKLIKPELKSREVLARFAAERQALALMDHPNIARILDAGTTAAGQPYFAMEYVVGPSLTKYCDLQRLTVNERLELFATVCQGVQHAHQKGIIHRDLKPNNILVAEVDGRPQPKIIDFGLAKALEDQPRLADVSQFTQVGQILGTLKYMAPEQARLDRQDIDTRADIYALGIILYELLTGTTPLDDSSLRGHAVLQAIKFLSEHDPVKPSSKLSHTSDEALSSVTTQRRTDRSRLRSVLRGELDWIVMKSLEKDRERRYATAASLAEDVRRCLAGHPIQARPPSWWYQTRKFLRRNPVSTAVSSLVLVAGVVIAWQAYRVSWANELLRRQEVTSAFIESINRRVDAQRGWTWPNRERIREVAREGGRSGAVIVEPADWRSELLATHAASDIRYSETLLKGVSLFDLKFHPQRENEVLAIDLKGAAGRPRHVRKLTLQSSGATEEVFSYPPDPWFELQNIGKQDGGRFLAWQPSGELVAWGTRAGDVIVRRYDRLEEDLVRLKVGSKDSKSVTFSPDGRYLYVLNDPKLQRFDGQNEFAADREVILPPGLHFKTSPRDGTLRVAGGPEYDMALQLVEQREFPNGHFNPVYSPDGLYLAATDNLRRVVMYGLDTTETVRVLGEALEVVNMDFSQDGRFLCVAGEEQSKLWDLYDGRLMLDVKLSRGGRIKGAFSPDGRTMLLCKPNGVDRYDLQQSELFRVVGIGAQPVRSFRRIGDDLLIMYHSYELKQITVAHWDLSSGRMKNFIVLRPDSMGDVLPLLVDEERRQAVVGWLTSAETGLCVLSLEQPDWQTSERQVHSITGILKWAGFQHGQVLVSRNREQWLWRGWSGEVDRTVFDVSLRELVTAGAKICATERFGNRMLAGSEAGDWYCFDPTEQKLMSSGRLSNTVAISSLSGSLAGDRVAVGNIDGEVYLLSLGSSETLGSWVVGEGEVTAMAWIDEQTLVTASRSGAVVVWTLGEGLPQRFATLLRSESPVLQMDFDVESQTLLVRQEGRYGVGVFSWPALRASLEFNE